MSTSSLGYKAAFSADNKDDLDVLLREVKHVDGPLLIQVRVKKGNRKDLGRPSTTPVQNKEALMAFLKD